MKINSKKYPKLSHVLAITDFAQQAFPTLQGAEAEARKSSDPSIRPPKKWWADKYKEIKAGNPSYSEEQIRKTLGNIWYGFSDYKRREIRESEGKHYGKPK